MSVTWCVLLAEIFIVIKCAPKLDHDDILSKNPEEFNQVDDDDFLSNDAFISDDELNMKRTGELNNTTLTSTSPKATLDPAIIALNEELSNATANLTNEINHNMLSASTVSEEINYTIPQEIITTEVTNSNTEINNNIKNHSSNIDNMKEEQNQVVSKEKDNISRIWKIVLDQANIKLDNVQKENSTQNVGTPKNRKKYLRQFSTIHTGDPWGGYDYDGTICWNHYDRILCGYNKNKEKLKEESIHGVNIGDGCVSRGDRYECNYHKSQQLYGRSEDSPSKSEVPLVPNLSNKIADDPLTNEVYNDKEKNPNEYPLRTNTVNALSKEQISENLKKIRTACVEKEDRVVCYDF